MPSLWATERPSWRPAREISVIAACGTGALSAPRTTPRTGTPPPPPLAWAGASCSSVATAASRWVPSACAAGSNTSEVVAQLGLRSSTTGVGTVAEASASGASAAAGAGASPEFCWAAWARPPVVRNGTSLMNSMNRKATNAHGAP